MKQAIIITLAIATAAFNGQLCSKAVTNEVASLVQDLGITEGKYITNGFVFIDGKYIDPPYVVTRQGNCIYINDRMIEQPCPWPIPKIAKPVIPTEEIPMPKSITSSTTKYDKELQRYIYESIIKLKLKD